MRVGKNSAQELGAYIRSLDTLTSFILVVKAAIDPG